MLILLKNVINVLLVANSLFIIFMVLIQKTNTSSSSNLASSDKFLTSIFGISVTNSLIRITIYSVIIFFVLGFILQLIYVAKEHRILQAANGLPSFDVNF